MLFLIPVVVFLNLAFSNPFSGGSTFEDQEGLTETYLVKGKVLDDNTGEPLPGASVIISNTYTGTITDKNGEFSLTAENEKISFTVSYIGFKTAIVKADNDKYLEIRFKRDVYKLNLEQPKLKDFTDHVKSDSPVEKSQDEVNVIVEDVPHFPGGIQALCEYISLNTQYPKKAMKMNISGKVIVRFLVDKQGNVKDVAIEKGVDSLLDQEALRVVSNMPKWKPGEQGGKAVGVTLSVPVEFKLK